MIDESIASLLGPVLGVGFSCIACVAFGCMIRQCRLQREEQIQRQAAATFQQTQEIQPPNQIQRLPTGQQASPTFQQLAVQVYPTYFQQTYQIQPVHHPAQRVVYPYPYPYPPIRPNPNPAPSAPPADQGQIFVYTD
jgi:hypothetical protein